jgi:hypothetical protein
LRDTKGGYIPIHMGVVGVILYYLAAGNLWLALTAGTCTQGNAGRLYGGLLSLLLFGAAFIPLWRAARPVRVAIALLPLVPLLVLATLFTVRFLVGYWWWNATACDVLEGADGYFADGDEPVLTMLWAALTILAWSGALAIGLRAGRQVTRAGA